MTILSNAVRSSLCHPPADDTQLFPLDLDDFSEVRDLVQRAFAPVPRPWVLATLHEHERSIRSGVADGRSFFVRRSSERIIGFCGIHKYVWGPPHVCWASWFAVEPRLWRTITPYQMGRDLARIAKSRDFASIYVETYSSHPQYSRIAEFLPRAGCQLQARLPGFFAPDVDCLIFHFDLTAGKHL